MLNQKTPEKRYKYSLEFHQTAIEESHNHINGKHLKKEINVKAPITLNACWQNRVLHIVFFNHWPLEPKNSLWVC